MAYDVTQMTAYIREAAKRRGVDPDIAVRVARSEGLGAGVWQSNFSKGGQREPSFGPFQLLVGGEGTNYPAGMGNDFKRRTGLDPSDPSNVNATIDFALDHASKNGWGAWYGAAKAGVGKRDGIGGQGASSPLVSAVAERQAPRGAAAAVSDMGAGGQSVPSEPAGGSMATPTVNIGIKPKRDTKAYDTMLQRALAQGSQSQNPWDVVGSLAQVYAASSEKKEAEAENASELQKVMAAAGLDPAFAMMAQLGGDRESAAQAIGAQQQFRAQTAQRAEDQAWRQDERGYQRGRDTVKDRRADAELELQRQKIAKGEGAPKTSLSPVYGTDETGNAVLLQPRDDGTVVQSKLPDGVKVSTGVEKIDAGTHWVLQDKRSGQTVGTIPKENFQEARDTASGAATGKTEAERAASAPGDAQSAQNALDLIQTIRDDPYKSRGTGGTSLLNVIPGTGGYDFANRVESAKAGAFLQAIQSMRGLGALSNTEGSAATAAITRMDTATSEEAFDEALNDYEKIVRQGLAKAQGNAGVGGAAPAAPAAPMPKGPVPLDDLMKKYGG